MSRGRESPPPGAAFAPAAVRNAAAIEAVLREALPATGRVLEVAAGTGQHAVAFAAAFPDLTWAPSDPDPAARASIAAWAAGRGTIEPPLDIDATDPGWPTRVPGSVAAILAVNLLHIAPWAATEGLLDGAATLLPAGAPLVVYGCFTRDGRHLSRRNAAFDGMLRAEDPAWGVRDVATVADTAASRGLTLARVAAMPADNLCLVLRRVPPPQRSATT